MDVIWLKKDIRLHDHGPLAEVTRTILSSNSSTTNSSGNASNSSPPFCILYLFEPDQLSEPTVHGSHICFINESLVDLDRKLSGSQDHAHTYSSTTRSTFLLNINQDNPPPTSHHHPNIQNYKFQTLTICHANAVFTFAQIHSNPNTKIKRILSHQETGHYKSYMRDKALGKWCKRNNVQWIEFNQTGVTRCLKDRDSFAKKLGLFLMNPLYSNYDDIILMGESDDCEERGGGGGRRRRRREKNNFHNGESGNGSSTSTFREEKLQPSCINNSLIITSSNMSSSTITTTKTSSGASKSATSILKSIQDEYNANYKTIPTNQIIATCQKYATTNFPNLHNRIYTSIQLSNLTEIPPQNRVDRLQRQQIGGESHALDVLHTFLNTKRGSFYSSGISSPNTSWTSCSRLSPYLTWGCISIRYVIHETRKRQEYFRNEKKKSKKDGKEKKDNSTMMTIPITKNGGEGGRGSNDNRRTLTYPKTNSSTTTTTTQSLADGYWLKSLQAFTSRMHWRSHFIQKLETEPEMEKRDLCPAYQHLRRQPNDWNQSYYDAWSTGQTGFPFVDACMRCLIQHGWLNFRMRAMLVSFASYNLWLDWKRIAPHLARVFLDYEPGIHYPQLQMQSGTTGINAMRVYNVTKQSKDQDPNGVFIKKYIPELKDVPVEYIHEPFTMSMKLQHKLQVFIGSKEEFNGGRDNYESDEVQNEKDACYYPKPIVNETKSAKNAKDKIAAVRKLESTKEMAEQVYEKHGSRNNREREMGRKSKSPSSSKLTNEEKGDSPQPTKKAKTTSQKSIIALFAAAAAAKGKSDNNVSTKSSNCVGRNLITKLQDQERETQEGTWNCGACTYLNTKPLALACSMCGTIRKQK